MDALSLVIQLAAGAAGGSLAGKLITRLSLGSNAGNMIAGILGGGLAAQLVSLLGLGGGEPLAAGIGGVLGSVLAGGLGGTVLMAVVGLVKSMLVPKQNA